ncbi:MAG: helix-turn-helix domain-containing protein [Arcobacter sp.]|uniref:helix-turn-helix domain-containing protein n=1 Tax=Arcobacter sp. TaxID=1872629 RepID=UPI003C713938
MYKRVRKGSHCEKILDYLKKGNTLTSWEAIDILRIQNLAQRIAELEDKGYMINREHTTENNIKVTRYSYAEEKIDE